MSSLVQQFETIPLAYFYHKLNSEFQTFQIKNIARNSTSFFHALSTIILGLNYYYTNKYSYLIAINTGGFFIFDALYIIKNGKFDTLNGVLLYHHTTLYPYLFLSSKYYYWPQSIFFGELSNIPSYFVYYSLKNDEKKNLWKGYKSEKTKRLLRIQMYFYGFFRIFVLGYYYFLELKNPRLPKYVLVSGLMYPFGVIWSLVMIKRNICI